MDKITAAVVMAFLWIAPARGTTITFNEPGLVPGFATGFPGETRTPTATLLGDQFRSLGVVFSAMRRGSRKPGK